VHHDIAVPAQPMQLVDQVTAPVDTVRNPWFCGSMDGMGINFDDIKKKAQDALGQNADKIEHGIDKASGFAKSKLGQHSDKIDNVTTKAKDFLHKNQGDQGPEGGTPGPGTP
jgi:hypothetical protein